jgi:Spy/CpxP family protein refolding chaperone
MLKRLFVPMIAASVLLGACGESPTAGTAAAADTDDYALLMFGEAGAALEGTLGPQEGTHPFDGRTYRRPFPDSLQLTDEQRARMDSLRTAFREEWADELDALRAIFEEARAARAAGATREEVRAILLEGRPLGLAIRAAVWELHFQLLAVLTVEQRAWLATHRPRHMPRPLAPRP